MNFSFFNSPFLSFKFFLSFSSSDPFSSFFSIGFPPQNILISFSFFSSSSSQIFYLKKPWETFLLLIQIFYLKEPWETFHLYSFFSTFIFSLLFESSPAFLFFISTFSSIFLGSSCRGDFFGSFGWCNLAFLNLFFSWNFLISFLYNSFSILNFSSFSISLCSLFFRHFFPSSYICSFFLIFFLFLLSFVLFSWVFSLLLEVPFLF